MTPLKYFLNRNHLDMIFSIGSCHRDLPDDHDLPRAGDGLGKLNTGFYVVLNNNNKNNNKRKSPHHQQNNKVIDLFSDALRRCIDSNTRNTNNKFEAGEGDQPAMNAVLDENVRRYQQQQQKQQQFDEASQKIHYGFFDGCLFANGCIYFKHLCANSTSLDPASKEAIDILKRGGKMPHYKLSSSKNINKNNLPQQHQQTMMIRRDDPVLVHANFLVGKGDKIKHLKKYGLWNQECIDHLKKRGGE